MRATHNLQGPEGLEKLPAIECREQEANQWVTLGSQDGQKPLCRARCRRRGRDKET